MSKGEIICEILKEPQYLLEAMMFTVTGWMLILWVCFLGDPPIVVMRSCSILWIVIGILGFLVSLVRFVAIGWKEFR
jgi:hypothetical protein